MLMKQSQLEMADIFKAEYVSLHVRKSNRAAFHLYTKTLKYEVHDIEKGYYANGEDAYDMRCYFRKEKSGSNKEHVETERPKDEATISNDPIVQNTLSIEKAVQDMTLQSSEHWMPRGSQVVLEFFAPKYYSFFLPLTSVWPTGCT